MAEQIIAAVYLWPSGTVMVFDLCGEQIAEYQKYNDPANLRRILTDAPETARFYVGEYRGERAQVNRASWKFYAGLGEWEIPYGACSGLVLGEAENGKTIQQ